PGIDKTIFVITPCPPTALKTFTKKFAPIKIHNHIPVKFTVKIKESLISFHVNFPYTAFINKNPAAPIAAASDGVATPYQITPNTNTIKIINGHMLKTDNNFSLRENLSSFGVAGPI